MKLTVDSFHTGATALARKIADTRVRLAASGIVCEAHFTVAERSEVLAMRASVARATGLIQRRDDEGAGTASTAPALTARPDLAALVRRRGGPR
jgi:hypothetical protein